ncbi:UDP-N-acetylglucosamine transporter-like isoform X1 [Sipha flava]|uniref:UDP-N-acetylglucosamine transporter-like isoform X1 n=1 Tax=Sipha flava TaxID=143950 RepID=A0A2S2PYD4_9HEMI|nr:UDP-N-acetylglucosamine transporter-like isoform X1 [Sipha flava]XP_025418804.1 UDP-N-acetylglucosamine transporter-like isoform X1 [Sipha flava]
MTEEKTEIQLEVQVENMQSIQQKRNSLKLIALVTLTLQNAIVALSMRYARTRAGDMFIASTAVFMAEPVKLIVCLVLVYRTESISWKHFISILDKTIIKQPMDTLKVCIPSLVYVIQNNLLYVSTSNLDAATYQVTYQLKIFTTALFSVLILKRKLLRHQWIALAVLITGVVLVQLNNSTDKTQKTHPEQNRWIGLLSALVACFLSGFAGVYFEKILKGAEISIWMRNIQLSFVSIPLGFIVSLKDWTNISNKGFFYGYDLYIVYLICLQAAGGLIVAMVVKYADNILKGFATSLAIVVACVFSMYFFDFTISIQFVVGTFLVMLSIFLYSYTKGNKSPNLNTIQKA